MKNKYISKEDRKIDRPQYNSIIPSFYIVAYLFYSGSIFSLVIWLVFSVLLLLLLFLPILDILQERFSWVESQNFLTTALHAFFEEILFRLIIQNLLCLIINVYVAVIVQAILFGLAHFKTQKSLGITMYQSGIFGLVLGFIYYFSGSLIIPMFLHSTWNNCIRLYKNDYTCVW